jgi:SAM-dependent methyltransferase
VISSIFLSYDYERIGWSEASSMASAVSSLRAGDGNERFNQEAAAWDANPFVHEMSAEAWKALQKHVPCLQSNSKDVDVLEIGCGTGLLSFLVAPAVHEVVAVDAAQGMIDVLRSKIERSDTKNIVPVAVLLEDPEDPKMPPADPSDKSGPRKCYDLITSHLVLHHIADLQPVLKTMLGCLKPGGEIALTDFEDFGLEAKRFHPQSKMGGVERHGINVQWMTDLLQRVGFEDVNVVVAWNHKKKVERWSGEFEPGKPIRADQGELMDFTYVLCRGRRPG